MSCGCSGSAPEKPCGCGHATKSVSVMAISATNTPTSTRTHVPCHAIQGRVAMHINRIHGSYSGIMGLPLWETASLLQAAGIKIQ